METARLKKFAQFARRSLIDQVSAKLKRVMAENSPARRESAKAIKLLDEAIRSLGQEQVVERVAYTWFNRFCALRFMDVNRYTRIAVVSPAEGQFQPEILADAKMGHVDEEMVPVEVRQQIVDLLSGKAPSRDPQGEVYSLLVVAACNSWNVAMPFLFERIDDYTELLMPDDLLSGKSILAYTREAMTPDACRDVDVIGWLYQFYISEKKDEVFDGLKRNKKIAPADIPAATQLFTPPYIVHYLVENSLGRLWMLNRPNSKLIERMNCYTKPEQPETEFLRIGNPEEIKICDPACGSGHMLTYAFDLLYDIYEEEGYDAAEIPEKILTHNLHGIEIDERAGELSAFALIMKAVSRLTGTKQRRFFRKGIKPNICVLEAVKFDTGELDRYMEFVGHDLFTLPLLNTLHQFEEADNFGSLIRPDLTEVETTQNILDARNVSGQLFLSATHKNVQLILRQAEYLRAKYHVVIANPPYMGGKGMNGRLGAWAKNSYPQTKSDLFAMFIERNQDLAKPYGLVAMVTMQSWMFLSSFEALRTTILEEHTILSMAHLGARAFGSIGGEVVSTTAFVIENAARPQYKGAYLRLVDGGSEAAKEALMRESVKNHEADSCYFSSSADFKKIPGSPITYWVSENTRSAFVKYKALSEYAFSDGKNITGDNDKYQRFCWEVSANTVGVHARWVFISKGGGFRKWIENKDITVDWSVEARDHYRKSHIGRIIPEYIWFRKGITWSLITTSSPSFRLLTRDFTFSDLGLFFHDDGNIPSVLAFLNSTVACYFLKFLNPTINYPMEVVLKLPVSCIVDKDGFRHLEEIVDFETQGLLQVENSWEFSTQPLLTCVSRQPTLEKTYELLSAQWRKMTLEMQRLEEENNRVFIDIFELQDELTPNVQLSDVTLVCNPYYRYGSDKREDDLERLLLADTMRDLLSYAVGCMFGRFALDKPGLILANQGETFEDYLRQIPESSFPANEGNVIPMLDGDWFSDDIAERFRNFLRVAFGEEHYEKNLKFIEAALNVKGKRDYTIHDYFLGEFYTDHVKRYRKRPIYWMFSSPNGSFNALIYMHRYRPDAVSVVLNDYLREFRNKLTSNRDHLGAVSISASATQGEKTKALKDIEKVQKMIAELEEYERDVLYPLATKQLPIDLDDGVKVNYPKFGAALKKIPGLDSEEE